LAVGALINDPTGFAWFVVASYLLGAAAAFLAGRSTDGRDARFWYAAALLLVLLGLNKELDLQSLLTDSARSLTQAVGWYEQRRQLQGLFLVALAIGGLAAAALLGGWLRRSPRSVKVAAAGIVILLTFIFMRAASFHHLDAWVTVNVGFMRSGWWLELAGIVVIAMSALAFRRQQSR
jgi:hypothetical protein